MVLFSLTMGVTYFCYSSSRTERFDSLATESQVVQTSVGPIEYQVIGESGPVVLFLHGTPGGYDQGFAMPGYRVLTPSRPGYLRTPLDVGSTPAQQAQAYAVLLDSLSIESVVVYGASGGGPSSIAFASLYPKRTSALIALEAVSQSWAPAVGAPSLVESDFMVWAALKFMGIERIVGFIVPDSANQQLILQNPEASALMEASVWSLWPLSLRDVGLQNDITQFQNLNLLDGQEIVAPTLIIHGTEDINVPFVQSEMLADQIPGSVLRVIEGGDHLMPFSHYEEVVTAVEGFLETLDLGGR